MPRHRRDHQVGPRYVEWIGEAKSDDTRQTWLDQATEWMAEGKPRNWKYMMK
jgi:hypothetical protein